MVFPSILGVVPVFSLSTLNPKFLNESERVFAALSPALPAEKFVFPIWMFLKLGLSLAIM